MLSSFVAVSLALSASVIAYPSLEARDATRLSPAQLASYSPSTQFARAAYCPSSGIMPWNCGGAHRVTVLTEVQKLLSSSGASTVVAVGHSLGGALAELDAMFFTLNLPPSVHVKAVTYGTPCVGNPAWATLFDSYVADFVRINNKQDSVPVLHPLILDFQHPHGEIHIMSAGGAYSCPGGEGTMDPQCNISQVPDLAAILDHLGPYEGIYIGTLSCT